MFDSSFFSYHACKYVHTTAVPPVFVQLDVSPINMLAGGATDDCLLHVLYVCTLL